MILENEILRIFRSKHAFCISLFCGLSESEGRPQASQVPPQASYTFNFELHKIKFNYKFTIVYVFSLQMLSCLPCYSQLFSSSRVFGSKLMNSKLIMGLSDKDTKLALPKF